VCFSSALHSVPFGATIPFFFFFFLAPPTIAAVAQRGRDKRSLVQGSLRIGDQQRRMYPHRRDNNGARGACARWVIERELGLVHLTGDQSMPGAAEQVIE